MADENPKYIELGATTGIAAINIGGRTIHSLLGYFDTESMMKAYGSGRLHENLRKIAKVKKVLGIEEVSMLPAEQLDIIFTAIQDINDEPYTHLGLHLIGDLAQLPPVSTPGKPASFCFKSTHWPIFEKNIINLDKIWRQDNLDFINAINAIRAGKGTEAVNLLKSCGVEFVPKIDYNYDGTTLISNNKDVDTYNNRRLAESNNPTIKADTTRRGVLAKEWEHIPLQQRFKLDSYVMILRNDSDNFTYVNGDCGHIVGYDAKKEIFSIKLIRTGKVVDIGRVTMINYQAATPNPNMFTSMFYPKLDEKNDMWIIGYIEYHPIRLAYASTVHKSQGLTLDKVQIDSNATSFRFPGICYVAVSRARTPDNLIIVGNERDFISKVKTDPQVMRYI